MSEKRPIARPLSEWTPQDGAVLWWDFPVSEPPWCGTPLDDNWPAYKTHWTPIGPVPEEPEVGGQTHG